MEKRKRPKNYIRNYPCFYDPERYVNSDGVFEETDLDFPQVYKTAEGMVSVAEKIKQANDSPLYSIPFCYTVELEAYGGLVSYGDKYVGPRPGAYVLEDPMDLLKLKRPNPHEGRMGEVIKATRLIKEKGGLVSVSTSGAFLIISGMMDIVPILMAMRKDKAYLREVFENMMEFELDYYKALAQAGADVISMTELSMANIFGPEISEYVVKNYLYPFFKEAEKIDGPALHMCPKSTYALVDTGHGTFEEAPLDSTMTYGLAMVEGARKGYKIYGRRCIGNIKIDVSPGGLRYIKLK